MSESRRTIIRENWRKRIVQHRSSGQSIAAFCREQGLSENSFYLWRRRLGGDGPAAFVELKTSPPAGVASAIDVCLGRRRLRVRAGFDRGLLIDLVRTLESIA